MLIRIRKKYSVNYFVVSKTFRNFAALIVQTTSETWLELKQENLDKAA